MTNITDNLDNAIPLTLDPSGADTIDLTVHGASADVIAVNGTLAGAIGFYADSDHSRVDYSTLEV